MSIKKLVAFLLLIYVLNSCDNKTPESKQKDKNPYSNWTDEQKRIFFQDSMANLNDGALKCMPHPGDSLHWWTCFSKVMFNDSKFNKRYDLFFYSFEEPFIEIPIDSNIKKFRILIYPTFRNPYCLIMDKKNHSTYITVKMLDGRAGYDLGNLEYSITKVYSDTFYQEVSNELHKLDFWNLHIDTTCRERIHDGETWLFEAIENGKYNEFSYKLSSKCDDKVSNELVQLGKMILDKMKFYDHLALFKNIDRKEIKEEFIENN